VALKAKEFHSLVRRELDPLLLPLGFKRTPRATWASWCRPVDDRWLVIWFQNSQHNGNVPGAAFEFTVEYQVADAPVPGIGECRARLYELLTEAEREQMRVQQNLVIGRLVPPADPTLGTGDARLVPFVLSLFRLHDSPYLEGFDTWFKQDGEAAVLMWATWLRGMIPTTVDRFLARLTAVKR
jgi:hypothetical protein